MLPKHLILIGVLLISLHSSATSQQVAQQQQSQSQPKPLTPEIKPVPAQVRTSQSQVAVPKVPVRSSVPKSPQIQAKPAAAVPSVGGSQPARAAQPQPQLLGKTLRTKPVAHSQPQPAASAPVQQQQQNPIKAFESLLSQYAAGQLVAPKPASSGPINSLVSSIVGSLGLNKIGKRSGKISPLDNALYSLNSIPDSTGSLGSGAGEFNINNINALNDMIGTALSTLNGVPGQPDASNANPGLMNQITSYLGKSKKIFDLPKQLYKSIGGKISGAGEAAASATVPIKDSLFSTLKSFYSFLKPSRSSSHPDASAGYGQQGYTQGDLTGAGGARRRQSMDQGYGQQYFGQPSGGNFNQAVQQSWQQWQNLAYPRQQQQQQQIQPQHHQQHNQQQQMYNQQQQVQQQHRQPIVSESQRQPQFAGPEESSNYQYLGNVNELQHKPLPYGARVQQPAGQQQHLIHPSIVDQHPKDHTSSGLYQKSKELFAKIARGSKRHSTTPAPVAQFPGQFLGAPAAAQHQLPSQTLAKVQSKLGTLPVTYNQQLQQLQAQQQPQQQAQQPQSQQQQQPQAQALSQSQQSQQQQNYQQQQGWTQQVPQTQQQQPSYIYYTQQPSQIYQSYAQYDGSQGAQLPLAQYQQQSQSQAQQWNQQPQSQQQTPSSTQASVVTSTSVSISKSISSSSSQNQQFDPTAHHHLPEVAQVDHAQAPQAQRPAPTAQEHKDIHHGEDHFKDQTPDPNQGAMYYFDGSSLNSRSGDQVQDQNADESSVEPAVAATNTK